MNEKTRRISNYYNKLVSEYGHDHKSCDYGQAASQLAKFNVLSGCTNYSGKSVLDIGCGFADYYDFLSKKFVDVDYSGVDISQAMITMARELHPNLDLEVRNVFEVPKKRKFDIVNANGIFYLLGKDAWPIMSEFIEKMYDMSTDVIAFNTLSTWAEDKVDGEFYADPVETLKFCKVLSPWVTLKHDYHSRDFSVFIYKKKR